MKQRDHLIDIAKGIGIFLVVLGHTITIKSITQIIYLFHMPLFYFLTGVGLIYSKNIELNRKSISKMAKSLLIPYISFSILSIVYWFFIERAIRGQEGVDVYSIALNIPLAIVREEYFVPNIVLWFLPSLFVSNIITRFLITRKKSKKAATIVISILLAITGLLLSNSGIYLPLGLELSLITSLFSVLGYYFGITIYPRLKQMSAHRSSIIAFILLGTIIVTSRILNPSLNIFLHRFNNAPLCLVDSLLGVISILLLSNIIHQKKLLEKAATVIGKTSLIIMLIHEPIKRIIIAMTSKLLGIDNQIIRDSYIGIVVAAIVMLSCIPIALLISKYFGLILGNFKTESNNR